MEELKLETGISSEKKSRKLTPGLFDFKPLLLQSAVLRTQDSFATKSVLEEDVQTPCSNETDIPFDVTFKQEEQKATDNKDYLNWSKTFNNKNLQTARLKNKKVIADNVRQ